MKIPIFKIFYLWNVLSIKFSSMKWFVYYMSYLQSVLYMILLSYEMSIYKISFSEMF